MLENSSPSPCTVPVPTWGQWGMEDPFSWGASSPQMHVTYKKGGKCLSLHSNTNFMEIRYYTIRKRRGSDLFLNHWVYYRPDIQIKIHYEGLFNDSKGQTVTGERLSHLVLTRFPVKRRKACYQRGAHTAPSVCNRCSDHWIHSWAEALANWSHKTWKPFLGICYFPHRCGTLVTKRWAWSPTHM